MSVFAEAVRKKLTAQRRINSQLDASRPTNRSPDASRPTNRSPDAPRPTNRSPDAQQQTSYVELLRRQAEAQVAIEIARARSAMQLDEPLAADDLFGAMDLNGDGAIDKAEYEQYHNPGAVPLGVPLAVPLGVPLNR